MSRQHILDNGILVETMVTTMDLLEEHGWNRGTLIGRSGSYDIVGAFMEARRRLSAEYDWGKLPKLWDFAHAMGFDAIVELVLWNDAQPDRGAVIDRIKLQVEDVVART